MSYIKTLTARNENQKKTIIELREKVAERNELLREQKEDNQADWRKLFGIIAEVSPGWVVNGTNWEEALRNTLRDLQKTNGSHEIYGITQEHCKDWLDLYEIISEFVPEWSTPKKNHPWREAIRMALHSLAAKRTSMEDKAKAWEAVYDTMEELVPNFISYGNTGRAMAVNIVKSLTKKQDNISKDANAYRMLSTALRIENPSYTTQHGDVSNETAACLEIYSVFRKNRRLTARLETIEKTLAQMNLKVL